MPHVQLNEASKGERVFFGIVLLAGFWLRIGLFHFIHFTADDALITFRYAANLIAGNGFVYNLGERVLGTTTPLFTILLTVFESVGVSPFWASIFINASADLFTAYVLYSMWSKEIPFLRIISPVVFLFNPFTLQWTLSGMETGFYTGLIFLAFHFSFREKWNLAFLLAAFAVLTRIDGAAAVVALMAAYTLRRFRFPFVPFCIFLLTISPWFVFSYFYFGALVPNSAAAKWALSEHHTIGDGFYILFRGFLHLQSFGIPFLLLGLVGTWRIAVQRKELLALPIWTWGYALSYGLAAGPMHPWYYVPFYAGYIPLICMGAVPILDRIKLRTLQWAAVAVVTCIVLGLSYFELRELRAQQQQQDALNRAVGEWVSINTPASSEFSVKDIGYAGYYSRRKILDLAGLVSPECIPYRAKGDFLGPIYKFQPDYFAFSKGQIAHLSLETSSLMKQYQAVKTIVSGTGSYTIYGKIKSKE